MFASRTLSPAETRYAQVEKEALALTWACEKFSNMILGSDFVLVTDHKPLVVLLGQKPIGELSPRLQRFRMRLLNYQYCVQYVPGKHFYTPDCLSRSAEGPSTDSPDILEEEELFINSLISALPCTDVKMKQIIEAQNNDEECKNIWETVKKFSPIGGPRINRGSSKKRMTLMRLHEGHMGITKCRRRAQESVWWPGYSQDIQKMVKACKECIENSRINKAEPLITTKLPEQPWLLIGVDLFKHRNKWYLVVQDYYSRFLEIIETQLTSAAVINKMKCLFARFGIPREVRTDGGTQFTSKEFKEFTVEYGFQLSISSPHYPQANGEAEKAVDIAKRILLKCKDPLLGLLAYRCTPLESGMSPAELLFG
ncbi:hypothetical protein O3M35_012973 [Rhynocoris fuscipes]|uniref:RNA-directed DNA polymerase n=1 Tax=Rhynocoris fuscipes TaxID=488301 RepID=A0AAW1CHJ7_9HEMI